MGILWNVTTPRTTRPTNKTVMRPIRLTPADTTLVYQLVVLSNIELNPLKKKFCVPCLGLRISAQIAGLRVRAFIELKKVEIAMVREN